MSRLIIKSVLTSTCALAGLLGSATESHAFWPCCWGGWGWRSWGGPTYQTSFYQPSPSWAYYPSSSFNSGCCSPCGTPCCGSSWGGSSCGGSGCSSCAGGNCGTSFERTQPEPDSATPQTYERDNSDNSTNPDLGPSSRDAQPPEDGFRGRNQGRDASDRDAFRVDGQPEEETIPQRNPAPTNDPPMETETNKPAPDATPPVLPAPGATTPPAEGTTNPPAPGAKDARRIRTLNLDNVVTAGTAPRLERMAIRARFRDPQIARAKIDAQSGWTPVGDAVRLVSK